MIISSIAALKEPEITPFEVIRDVGSHGSGGKVGSSLARAIVEALDKHFDIVKRKQSQ